MYSEEDIQFQELQITGLKTRLATVGDGPMVLFVHGWPECWYSWRKQMVAVANAGYQAVAPDMPGYGGTDGFSEIEDFNTVRISEFLNALVGKFSSAPAIVVGHDWGASLVWDFAFIHPNAVSKLVTMSVPLRVHSKRAPIESYRARHKENFFYQLYFQEPGLAEAEFDADPRGILSRLLASPDTPREEPKVGGLAAEGGGWIARLGAVKELPEWLTEEDLQYYVDTFTRSGFRGGINYYRNIDRNWELMAPFAETVIECPVLFVCGSKDNVIMGASKEKLEGWMLPRVPKLKVVYYEGLGHWIQNEAADEVSQELVAFIKAQG